MTVAPKDQADEAPSTVADRPRLASGLRRKGASKPEHLELNLDMEIASFAASACAEDWSAGLRAGYLGRLKPPPRLRVTLDLERIGLSAFPHGRPSSGGACDAPPGLAFRPFRARRRKSGSQVDADLHRKEQRGQSANLARRCRRIRWIWARCALVACAAQ
jgi:hypothetical protein